MTITSNISTVNISSPTGGIYLSESEISNIKSKINSDLEPWKTAYNSMITKANTALGTAIQSVTYGGPVPSGEDPHNFNSYWTTNPSDAYTRYDYFAAMAMASAVLNLGMGYAFSNNLSYANHAVDLINAWCVNSATKMNPKFITYPCGGIPNCRSGQSYIEIPQTMDQMYYGASLLMNYSGWTTSDKTSFKNWVNDLSISRGRTKEANPTNYMEWEALFIAVSGAISGNQTDIDWGINYSKELISSHMANDGSFLRDRDRSEGGLFYSTFALMPKLMIAELARHHNIDIYSYKLTDGTNRGLELALDFHATYLNNPPTWPYSYVPGNYDEPGRLASNSAIYEIANNQKQKSVYQNVINHYGRPMYDYRVLGYTTLTHGT